MERQCCWSISLLKTVQSNKHIWQNIYTDKYFYKFYLNPLWTMKIGLSVYQTQWECCTELPSWSYHGLSWSLKITEVLHHFNHIFSAFYEKKEKVWPVGDLCSNLYWLSPAISCTYGFNSDRSVLDKFLYVATVSFIALL